MPTYEYQCGACDHQFEEFQSMSAKPLRKCPSCGKQKLQRLIGVGAGLIFKGGGFYETDYRSDSYKKAEKADRDASSGGGEKASPGEAKPAEPKATPKKADAPNAGAAAGKSTKKASADGSAKAGTKSV